MFPGRNPNSRYAGIFIKEQIDALSKKGITFDFVFIDGYKSKFEYFKSIFTINYTLFRESKRYDAIHIHYGLTGLFLLFNPTSIKNKTVLTLHGSDISIKSTKYVQRFISRLLVKKVHDVIVVNNDFLNETKTLNSSVHIIPCGINADFFSPPISHTEITDVILFPSCADRAEKNFGLFEQAFRILKEKNPSLSYKCLDKMDRNQVRTTLQKSTLLMMTSLSEGSPQVVKEALACCLPVVSVPVGDVSTLLNSANNSFVTNSYSAYELASACEKIIQSGNRCQNGPRIIAKLELSNSSIAERIKVIYSKVAKS